VAEYCQNEAQLISKGIEGATCLASAKRAYLLTGVIRGTRILAAPSTSTSSVNHRHIDEPTPKAQKTSK